MGRTTMTRELVELRARVEQWRREGGGRGATMPEELWQEAVRVAGSSGVWATAHSTRLKYESLKARVGKAAASASPVRSAPLAAGRARVSAAERRAVSAPRVGSRVEAPGEGDRGARGRDERGSRGEGARFVAVQVTAPAAGGRQTTIELVGRHGDRMRVDVAGGVDLVGLVQAFWSRPS